MGRVRRTDFENLLEPGADLAFEWPVAKRYGVLAGQIYASDKDTITIFPLFQYPDLFLSFAWLGRHGEPSERRVLEWVRRYGLLTRRVDPGPDEPESWGESPQDAIEPKPIKLSDFRTEVRAAYQLLSLYTEIRARDTEAVMRRFIDPPDIWPHASYTLVDRYLLRYQQAFGEAYRATVHNAGLDSQLIHFKHGLDILIRCVNRKLEKVHPLLEQNWWEPPPAGSTSIGLERWWRCPDLLTAMYLQFYLLITGKTAMRICANPNCGMPFPATRKDKRFCSPGCRSTGRNHPH